MRRAEGPTHTWGLEFRHCAGGVFEFHPKFAVETVASAQKSRCTKEATTSVKNAKACGRCIDAAHLEAHQIFHSIRMREEYRRTGLYSKGGASMTQPPWPGEPDTGG
jgi:hypothetical protein